MSIKKKIFFSVMTLGLVISVIMAIVTRGDVWWDQIFQHDKTDVFMDFFHSMTDSSKDNPYSYGVLYPPITYLFYRFLAAFIPANVVSIGGHILRENYASMMVFFFYTVFSVLAFAGIIRGLYKDRKTQSLLIVLLIMSGPFLFMAERGNSVIVAFVFAGIFFLWKDSENKIKKEIALIALGISFGIKIYPAIFGLILIRDKKYKEAIRCIIYALLLFFIPFFAIGGIGAVGDFIKGISNNMDKEGSVEAGIGYKISFQSTYIALSAIFLRIRNTEAFMGFTSWLGHITSATTLLAAMFSKKRWQTVALLTCFMLGFPGFSYQYMLIFMAIPLTMFLQEEQKFDLLELCYTVLYIFQFILFTINIITVAYLAGGVCLMKFLNLVENCGLIGMTWLLIIEVFVRAYLEWKKGRPAKIIKTTAT